MTWMWVLRIGAFLACAYISADHMANYWYIGSAFGVVVLVWQETSLKSILRVRNVQFFVASTLIYVLVFVIAMLRRHISSLTVPVGVGTILLPLAHSLLLRTPWKRAVIAIPSIYAVWMLINSGFEWMSHSFGEEQFWHLLQKSKVANLASMWQAPYLAFMLLPTEGIWRKVRGHDT